MTRQAIVVLELGAHLPRGLDAELGPDSSLLILCERPVEGALGFSDRIRATLDSCPRDVLFAALVCGDAEGRARSACRGDLLAAFVERGLELRVFAPAASESVTHLVARYGRRVRASEPPQALQSVA